VEKASPETVVGHQVPLDEGATLAQSFLQDLSVHEPMYFLLGVEPGLDQSKFQFSFKYRLFNPEGLLAKKVPSVSGFHLGYTQRSIWDLKDDSKPFDDTSYMPELFYLLPKIDLNIERITAFGVQGGFQHESNGKGGDRFPQHQLSVYQAGHGGSPGRFLPYENCAQNTRLRGQRRRKQR
jgi:outer membrane phospholipase A